MRRAIPLICVCLLLAAAAPAFAQQRLFALTPKEIVEVDTNLSSLGRVLRRVPVPSSVVGSYGPNPMPAAGGALLAWGADSRLVLFETRSGSFQQYALPVSVSHVLGTSEDGFTLYVRGHSLTSNPVVAVDLRQQTVRILDLGVTASHVAYAPKSDLLFVSSAINSVGSEVHVRRAADGALLKSLSISPARWPSGLAVNASGTRLFVDASGEGTGLLAFDVASGARLAYNPAYPLVLASPIVDEHRRRLLIPVGQSSTPFIAALSIDTLELIGFAMLPPVRLPSTGGYYSAVQAHVSDQSATIFGVETVLAELGSSSGRTVVCEPSTLVALHTDTGQLRKAVDFTAVTGDANCYVRLVRLTEPAAPSGFSANVTGRSVSLSWGAEAATHYELEAGSGPGLANLARVRVDGTQLTVDNVPPGVYHLRVRAINTIGKSGASREVQLIVP